jgi:predicted amidohydrolase
MADVQANLALLDRAAGQAVEQGAGLIVCPEMFLTGYNIGDAALDLAEPADGPMIAHVCDIAVRRSVNVICGYPERAGHRVFNAAAAISRDGRLLASYRKTHLFGEEEKKLFAPGEGFVTTDIDGVRVGILICYDIEFPEPARTLAVSGIEFLAVPTSLMEPAEVVAQRVVPTRACENQIFVAYANRPGRERHLVYVGQSCIVGPDGVDLARAGRAEELLVAALDTAAISRARANNHYLADRRPPLYRGLQAEVAG